MRSLRELLLHGKEVRCLVSQGRGPRVALLSLPRPTRLLRCFLPLPQGLRTCHSPSPGPLVAGSFLPLRNSPWAAVPPLPQRCRGVDFHPNSHGSCLSVSPWAVSSARPGTLKSRAWLRNLELCLRVALTLHRTPHRFPLLPSQHEAMSPVPPPPLGCPWPVCVTGTCGRPFRGVHGPGLAAWASGEPPVLPGQGGEQSSPIFDLEL